MSLKLGLFLLKFQKYGLIIIILYLMPCMFKKIIESYYKLLDEKLENGTFVVLIIAILIVLVSLLIWDTNAFYQTNNNIQNSHLQSSIVEIEWTKYKMILEKILK